MATFTSKPAVVNQSAEALADKFSDLTRLNEMRDRLPEEQRQKVGDLKFTPDTIEFNTAQVGAITLKVVERTPGRIKLDAVGSPMPMSLLVNFKPLDAESTELTTAIDVDVPIFLKPMIGKFLQPAVDQFADLLGNI